MAENEGQKPQQGRSGKIIGAGENRIKGVFSTQEVQRVGTGTTSRKTIQKTYWYADEPKKAESDTVMVQPLNVNYIPSGPKREIPKEDFIRKFNPEPEFYVTTVYPKIRELDETIVRGEKHRESGNAYSAEFEFKQATAVDEENVRANFGLGLTYLDRGDSARANDIFQRVVKLDAAFDSEHKHLFNDFGINLRKNKMLDQALEYYLRGEDLEQNDENLFHNIARVYYEKGDLEKCVEYLNRSLEINPDMQESKLFMAFLEKQGLLKKLGQGGVPSAEDTNEQPEDAAGAEQPDSDEGSEDKPKSGKPVDLNF